MLYESPIGLLCIESDGTALRRLYLCTDGHDTGINDHLEITTATWLDAYFSRRPLPPLPAVRAEGSPFRKRVWAEMSRIAYGHTMSYGELARRVHSSARAIGGAVGANPVAIILPCHRVIAADGSIGGYAYGQDAKRTLLELEKGAL